MKKKFFIVGTKGIPANYGGLETFAHEISIRLVKRNLDVFVTCEKTTDKPEGPEEFEGVKLIYVNAPGNNFRTMISDSRALSKCLKIANQGDVIYILGYGVGPFAWNLIRKIKQKGIKFWLNPDGLEWKRPRWSKPVRFYLRFSEEFLLKRSDRIICDAAAIKDFHMKYYKIAPDKMEVIEYGAPEVEMPDDSVIKKRDDFLKKFNLELGDYYTYVGRFVADNNMELMVKGVSESTPDHKFLVLARHEPEDPFYLKLKSIISRSGKEDKIILSGGVYDHSLLMALRQGEFAYLHGHEVGGTNPALVEAMGLGSFIIALDTVFNKEVLQDAALYFNKDVEDLKLALEKAEELSYQDRLNYRERALKRVRDHYNWERITDLYEIALLK